MNDPINGHDDDELANSRHFSPVERGFGSPNAMRGAHPRRKGDDIAERLLTLGAGVIQLLPALGRKPGGRTLAKQLERCGPAGGSNYEEARGAESAADFVHKTRIALKEVRETRYWLRLAARAELLDRTSQLAFLIDEADQLAAILTASANTVKQRASRDG
jgi:four helix bundle protein